MLNARFLVLAAACWWGGAGAMFATPPASASGDPRLARRMHAAMHELPRIRVGQADADIVGRDNRALQAAVDYMAALGGGTVEIGPGDYLMRDSLHLRSFVTVRGTPGKTILRKAPGLVSSLTVDGDYGEEQITLAAPDGFEVGAGLAIWDAKATGFHITVARITGRTGKTISFDRPLEANCMLRNDAQAATIFPVVSGYDTEGVVVEHLIVEGEKDKNVYLDGCRGGGIYLNRSHGTIIRDCTVRSFNGDGISFQQSNDVHVERCTTENNAEMGLHPGSGSQRAVVRDNVSRYNQVHGLYLCWRVQHGLFEKNTLEANGRNGISIGHKDTDNVLRGNQVRNNLGDGVDFRPERGGMTGNRNHLEDNLIENNGLKQAVAGIRIRGDTRDLVLTNNVIRDNRPPDQRRQSIGIQMDETVGPVSLQSNTIDAATIVQDERKRRP